jgi:hypothetical protein
MANTNYLATTIKLLKISQEPLLKNQTSVITCQACLPQVKKDKVIQLFFWGKLAQEVLQNYRVNDYLLIDGFVSLVNKKNSKLKKVKVTVLKVYPIFLTANRRVT